MSRQLEAIGGSAPYTWTAIDTLPAGLSLSSAGLVTGTATNATAGSFYTVQVTDAAAATATIALWLEVVAIAAPMAPVAEVLRRLAGLVVEMQTFIQTPALTVFAIVPELAVTIGVLMPLEVEAAIVPELEVTIENVPALVATAAIVPEMTVSVENQIVPVVGAVTSEMTVAIEDQTIPVVAAVVPGMMVAIESAYDTDTTALLARFSGTYDEAAINDFITGLKTDGLWTTLDLLHIYAAKTSGDALLNWKGTSYSASAVSSPTFTVDRGFTMNGSSAFIDTTFNPATAGGNFVQDSATTGFYSRTVGSVDCSDTGSFDGVSIIDVTAQGYGASYVRLNSTTAAQFIAAATGGSGAFSASRTSALAMAFYRDGAALTRTDSNALTSNGLPNQSIYVGARNLIGTANSFSSRQYAAAWLASGWDATQSANFYSRLQIYLTAIGANV